MSSHLAGWANDKNLGSSDGNPWATDPKVAKRETKGKNLRLGQRTPERKN